MIVAFEEVDRILKSLVLDEKEKMTIYKLLAAILHLGNIEFISDESQAKVLESSGTHICTAAKLLNININDLEKSLLFHSIEVHGSVIM